MAAKRPLKEAAYQGEESHKYMDDFNAKLDQLLEGQAKIENRLTAYEAEQRSLRVQGDKHEKALYPNGSPGALQDIASLKSRVMLIFAIGGGAWGLFTIIFGIAMDKVFSTLSELAKIALTR